jgi:hypothetical protein
MVSEIINKHDKTYIEEIELKDWNIFTHYDNEIREEKSISAYWLNEWYDSPIKDYTFKTKIYENIDEIPDILPFERCAVRYENKSPKDSENWGPINTKEELVNIFYTSLRCKKGQGKYYCVREWKDLGNEYRCFWNNRLVAISSEEDTEPEIDIIINYINKLPIDFHKCVFDVAFLKDSEEMIFIEYNSWESNCGGHNFDWNIDTNILYPTERNKLVVRWKNNGEKIIWSDNDGENDIETLEIKVIETNNYDNKKIIKHNSDNIFIMDHDKYEYAIDIIPKNWLITEKYIYISTDIWLGRFDLDLKPLNWTRGVFRFSQMKLCENNILYFGDNYYYSDLSKMRLNEFSDTPKIIEPTHLNNEKSEMIFRYGVPLIDKNKNKIIFINLLENCTLHKYNKDFLFIGNDESDKS